MNILIFLLGVFGISFSGAMSPGPVTTASISLGTKNRHAGLLIALGHAIVEFPLILLLTIGLGKLVTTDTARIVTGIIGGVVLLYMAYGLANDIRKGIHLDKARNNRHGALMTGAILSVSNPYFLIWWATIGINMATRAIGYGYWLLPIFAVVHWLTDLIWFYILSWTSFKGASIFGRRGMTITLIICAALLAGFGIFFIADTAKFVYFTISNAG